MNGKAVAYAIGKMMQIMGVILCVPLGIAVYDLREFSFANLISHPETIGFIVAIITCFIVGTLVSYSYRADRDQQRIREGYAIVALGWIVFALMGSFPFAFSCLQSPAAVAQGG